MVPDLVSEVKKLTEERDGYLDMARHVTADFENYRKRTARQQAETASNAVSGLVEKLLPIVDTFDMAATHLGGSADRNGDVKALLQAGAMLFDLLAREGLERIDRAGVAFDPVCHDAIEHVPAGEPGAQTSSDPANPEGMEAGFAATLALADVAVADERISGDGGTQGGDGAIVTAVLRVGYRFQGRTLRPAMVRVQG